MTSFNCDCELREHATPLEVIRCREERGTWWCVMDGAAGGVVRYSFPTIAGRGDQAEAERLVEAARPLTLVRRDQMLRLATQLVFLSPRANHSALG